MMLKRGFGERSTRFGVLGFLGSVILLGGLWGCGEPPVCQNDTQCSSGRICLRGVCEDRSKLDASAETATEKKAEATAEIPEEALVEAKPEATPEVVQEATPEVVKEAEAPGIREQGQSCDPRTLAWPWDRCKPGLACAELGQTSPSSGAPQPYGICLPSCDPKAPKCPAGSTCIETKDTKTRQSTRIFVCSPEAEEGGFCTNDASCKPGFTCKLYGTTGTSWFCQKSCNQGEACASGQGCEAQEPSQPEKVCKNKAKIGEICNALITCEDGAACAPSGLVGVSNRCLKNCAPDPSLCDPQTEICSRVVVGSDSGSFCFKRSTVGGPCYGDHACGEAGLACVRDDATFAYASCLKICSATAECQPGEICHRFSQEIITQACVKALPGGSLVDTLTTCNSSARALAIAAGEPAFCSPECSLGTGTAPAKCGVLTPGLLLDLGPNQRSLWVVGEDGYLGCSTDKGATWQRLRSPVDRHYRGIAVDVRSTLMLLLTSQGEVWSQTSSTGFGCLFENLQKAKIPGDWRSIAVKQDGSAAVIVGSKATIAQSTDKGQTWKTIPPPSGFQDDLLNVAYGLPSEGGVWLAVGAKGSILRSTDDGATWTLVASGTTEALHRASLVTNNQTFQALIVGEKGTLLSSIDKGLTWKPETSGVTVTLRGIYLETSFPVVVGDAGIIVRFDQGVWGAITPPSVRDLYAVASAGTDLVAAGRGGMIFLSKDDGKTWTAVTKSSMTCLRVTSNGVNAGGACAFVCDPAKQGADCPADMGRCAALSGSTTAICQPASIDIPGAATHGQACLRNPRLPADQRCADGFLCVTGKQPKCVKRCKADATIPCDSGDTCLFSPELGNYFCGKAEALGQACDLSAARFCQAGARCTTTPGTQDSRCTALSQGDELATCLPISSLPCKPGLICIGLGSTPYRNYCARTCNPAAAAGQQGCDPGWDCLATTGGGGICAERCTGDGYACKAKHLICQQVTATTNKHCL